MQWVEFETMLVGKARSTPDFGIMAAHGKVSRPNLAVWAVQRQGGPPSPIRVRRGAEAQPRRPALSAPSFNAGVITRFSVY